MDPALREYLDRMELNAKSRTDAILATQQGLSQQIAAQSTQLAELCSWKPALDTASCVNGPVTASSVTTQLVLASAGLAEPPAPAPSIVASPVVAPTVPIDTAQVVLASCSTECAAQTATMSTTTALLPWASVWSPASPTTSTNNTGKDLDAAATVIKHKDAHESAIPLSVNQSTWYDHFSCAFLDASHCPEYFVNGVHMHVSAICSVRRLLLIASVTSICARHDAVSAISESMGSRQVSVSILHGEEDGRCTAFVRSDLRTILSSVLTMLGRTLDSQRGITRIFHCKATAKEFVGVIQAVLTAGKQLKKLVIEDIDTVSSQHKTVHSSLLRRLISTASSSTVLANAVKLLSCLNKDAADQGDMLNIFIASVDQFPEVAEGHATVEMAKQKLDLLIVEYRKQLGMRNLEYKTIAGTTYLIELPVDRRVPSNWMKVNSTKKTIRYHTPEILKNLNNLLLAKEELAVICRTTWRTFLMDFSKYYAQFQATVESLAALDCLYSLATLAKQNNYVKPNFVPENEASQIHVKNGRHPVLESLLGENFVPNDTDLQADGEYCQIVTGPNMGGKSCYIRQVALITIMAQVGSFVPASSARLHVVDGIYTRMGASDSIQQGTSTFYEELNEASSILHNCSSRSLVIIDELGRGTNTHDGVAIAYATLHYLLEEKKCIVIFVTHYPKILDIQREFEGSVGAYHVSYLSTRKLLEITDEKMDISTETDDLGEITFLYKLIAGASDRSFGLNVALLAQLPLSCIKRASVMAAKLQEELSEREENKLPRLMNKPDRDLPCENSPEADLVCAQPCQGLMEACRRVLRDMTSAQSSNCVTDTLSCLKNAKEVALKIV